MTDHAALLHEMDQLLQSAERAERYLASTPLPVASDVYSDLSHACDRARQAVADAMAAPSSTVGERVERLKFDLRQAMIDYGAAERAQDPERIRETSTRGVALIDSLAPLTQLAAQAEPAAMLDLFAEACAFERATGKRINEDVASLLGWLTSAVNEHLVRISNPPAQGVGTDVEDLMTKIQAFGLACYMHAPGEEQIAMQDEIRAALAQAQKEQP